MWKWPNILHCNRVARLFSLLHYTECGSGLSGREKNFFSEACLASFKQGCWFLSLGVLMPPPGCPGADRLGMKQAAAPGHCSHAAVQGQGCTLNAGVITHGGGDLLSLMSVKKDMCFIPVKSEISGILLKLRRQILLYQSFCKYNSSSGLAFKCC